MTPPSSGWKPSGSTIATRPVPMAPPPATPPAVAPTRLPSAPRERKPALAALALLLVVVGVLASVYLQIQARDEVGVIEITKQVAQGQQVGGADIAEVMVAKDSHINYVLWSQQALLGKYSATTNLVPGTLLIGQMLTAQVAANPNQVLVPLVLKPGDYPGSIATGQTLTAYFVPSTGSTSNNSANAAVGPQAGPLQSVTIVALPGTSSSDLGNSSDDVFTVSVDKSAATSLLVAASSGTIILVAPAAGS